MKQNIHYMNCNKTNKTNKSVNNKTELIIKIKIKTLIGKKATTKKPS